MRFFKSCRRVKQPRAREMLFLLPVFGCIDLPVPWEPGPRRDPSPERLASRHSLVQRKPQSPKVTSGV